MPKNSSKSLAQRERDLGRGQELVFELLRINTLLLQNAQHSLHGLVHGSLGDASALKEVGDGLNIVDRTLFIAHPKARVGAANIGC